ncbi:plant virulence effector HPE1-like domain-containing protein [Neorhizobium sp. JUb45]|uniref:plant virulence effector HPE1-like domain-containing protein n=1 Tax=unclassified Neorhizobium TaxID=2629175 RepID=UPI00104AF34C|nr:plant virulence effector HPE1-like domain-containing protein [Neorhizobium sp. JUb45]TCR04189.1 hypothetical protein EDF70_102287 [Neorhizobium sp. JUb45]
MRALVLTAAILSIGSPVLASSITQLVETGHTTSIVTKMCTTCDKVAPAKPDEGAGIYKVPALGPDIQKTEIRDINGQQKLVRTEGWWGGSPVTFISKMPEWLSTPEQKADATLPVRSGPIDTARAVLPSTPDGIDADATTAAVGEQPSERAGDAAAEQDDFRGFELRQQ